MLTLEIEEKYGNACVSNKNICVQVYTFDWLWKVGDGNERENSAKLCEINGSCKPWYFRICASVHFNWCNINYRSLLYINIQAILDHIYRPLPYRPHRPIEEMVNSLSLPHRAASCKPDISMGVTSKAWGQVTSGRKGFNWSRLIEKSALSAHQFMQMVSSNSHSHDCRYLDWLIEMLHAQTLPSDGRNVFVQTVRELRISLQRLNAE